MVNVQSCFRKANLPWNFHKERPFSLPGISESSSLSHHHTMASHGKKDSNDFWKGTDPVDKTPQKEAPPAIAAPAPTPAPTIVHQSAERIRATNMEKKVEDLDSV